MEMWLQRRKAVIFIIRKKRAQFVRAETAMSGDRHRLLLQTAKLYRKLKNIEERIEYYRDYREQENTHK